ncbi:STAS domain-containing protein [Kitasatospora purpeofusca]|uniref:STAS domain-containing protein n=1 Tax=Kitasatospora purpeofusca TaxID=67352 RepID=UPI0033D3B220
MPAYTLTIDVRTHWTGATVVVLSGELDHQTAPRLRRVVERTPAGLPLVLDLTELRFCDSIGIGELVFAARRTPVPEAALPVVGAPADLRHLLALTGVDGLVAHHDGVDLAVAALAPGGAASAGGPTGAAERHAGP